jgi:hypothetical protein
MNNGLGALRTDPDDEFLELPSLSREVMRGALERVRGATRTTKIPPESSPPSGTC